MGLFDGLLGKRRTAARETSGGGEQGALGEASGKSATTRIKKVYSFIAATTVIDLSTPIGKAMVEQIHAFACQQLSQGNLEFRRLYTQWGSENAPHEMGAGTAASSDYFAGTFAAWLRAKGIQTWDAADVGSKLFVFCGDAQDPHTAKPFSWGMSYYFDLED
jgi:hypothetical protein